MVPSWESLFTLNWQMFRCVATVDIAEGEEITTKYLPPTVCSLLRRPAMKEGWFFDCRSVKLDLDSAINYK